MKKLNIGCGVFRKEGYLNIDRVKTDSVDQVVDVEKGLPYKDNTFERVYSSHVLVNITNFEYLMKEIHRVCKPDALVEIIVAHFSSSGAFWESGIRFFTSTSFKQFTDFTETVKVGGMGKTTGQFEILKNKIVFAGGINPLNYFGWLINISDYTKCLYEDTFLRSIMPAKELHFILKVKK